MASPCVPGVELDEAVQLSPWSSAWPGRARALSEELSQLIGRDTPIEHIGSTAVEGLPAKPVLDLMIGLGGAFELEKVVRGLAGSGWTDLGEAGVAGRRHLRRRSGEQANLHLVRLGGAHWRNNLAIRDYLRVHRDDRRLYAECKLNCASHDAWLLSYSACKAHFMAALLERAITWRRSEAAEAPTDGGIRVGD